jgi:hypothetical protein
MKKFFDGFKARFAVDDAFTREDRYKATIKYAVGFTILVLFVLLPLRVIAWIRQEDSLNTFYFVNNLVCIALLFFTARLNDKLKTTLASELFIFLSCYLCFTAYPFQNADQILLYLAIPVSVSSFISDGRRSLRVLLFVVPLFLIFYQVFFSTHQFPVFSIICLILIAVISWRVSILVENMFNQLVSAYDSTIEGWAQALEMRNQETEGHSHRVVSLTLQLVEKLHIPANRWVHIQRGVLLHDIGKMGVPDTILCKAGPLTDSENMVMQRHPFYARELLNRIAYLAPAMDIPYCHHEKWDGTGYPQGLQGDAIPLEARIFSVIDVWDAMRSKRSYRSAIPEVQVIEYMRSERGRSFDPAVVDAFFNMMSLPLTAKNVKTRLVLNYPPQKLRR